MKAHLLAAILSFTAFFCSAQIQSDCTPSARLVKAYQADAAKLALKRLYEIQSPDTALIEIPQRYMDTIMSAFASVCNLDKNYEADSVFLHYCVHEYAPRSPIINVLIKPSVSWYDKWRNLNITTGDSSLDEFLHLHSVALVAFQDDPTMPDFLRHWASLRLGWSTNMNTFGDSLMWFRGLVAWDRFPTYGDGDAIRYWTDSLQHLRFIAGRGDCPLGCTEDKIWSYTISPGCIVQLDTVIDEIYQDRRRPDCNLAPVMVHTSSSISKALQVFPNPSQAMLFLRRTTNEALRYEVYDLAGKRLSAGDYESSGIDVSGLNAGLYFVRFTDTRMPSQTILRFVKQ